MQKSGEVPVDLSTEAAARLKAFVAEVERLWPGAELVEVRRLGQPDPLDDEEEAVQ